MAKDYVMIKDDEIIGTARNCDLAPGFEASELANGLEYREVVGETEESIQELTLVGGVVTSDKGRRNANAKRRRSSKYPALEEMLLAVLTNNTGEINRLKALVAQVDIEEPLEP